LERRYYFNDVEQHHERAIPGPPGAPGAFSAPRPSTHPSIFAVANADWTGRRQFINNIFKKESGLRFDIAMSMSISLFGCGNGMIKNWRLDVESYGFVYLIAVRSKTRCGIFGSLNYSGLYIV
jgi:hypothetical protein